MTEAFALEAAAGEDLLAFEAQLRAQLAGRVVGLRLVIQDSGVVLHGIARTYYAKQLAQHAVMQAVGLPIRANKIEVRPA